MQNIHDDKPRLYGREDGGSNTPFRDLLWATFAANPRLYYLQWQVLVEHPSVSGHIGAVMNQRLTSRTCHLVLRSERWRHQMRVVACVFYAL